MSRIVAAIKNSRFKLMLVFAATLAVVGGGTAAGVALTSSGADRECPTLSHCKTRSAPQPPNLNDDSAPSDPTTSAPQPLSIVPTGPPAPTTGNATVATTSNLISDTCLYSHEANDDPILQPGMTGTVNGPRLLREHIHIGHIDSAGSRRADRRAARRALTPPPIGPLCSIRTAWPSLQSEISFIGPACKRRIRR